MVMVKLSGGITEINGKSGGNVWRRDTCGQHVQKQPRTVHGDASPAQQTRQKAFRLLATIQRRCITTEIAGYWQVYANQHPKVNKKSEPITLSWWQMFIGYNINRVVDGEDPDLLPPGYELSGEISSFCYQYL